jgi:hypothetical protein
MTTFTPADEQSAQRLIELQDRGPLLTEAVV